MKAKTLWPLDERGWLATQPPAFREWMSQNGRWQQDRGALEAITDEA